MTIQYLHDRQARFASGRAGATLIELLLVITIMLVLVAAAIPVVRPALADRKVREAAREFGGLVARAKSLAVARNRPITITFDRVTTADKIDTPSSQLNLVNRVYLAESPLPYAGMMPESRVWFRYDSTAPIGQQTTVWFYPFLDGIPADSYNPLTEPDKLDLRMHSLNQGVYLYPPNSGPFTIRVGRPAYSITVRRLATGEYVWVEPTTLVSATGGPYLAQRYRGGASFEVLLPPVRLNEKPLEFPTGTVVDLRWSGLSQQNTAFGFYAEYTAAPYNYVIPTNFTSSFTILPSGAVSNVSNVFFDTRNVATNVLTAMTPAASTTPSGGSLFFLVGTVKQGMRPEPNQNNLTDRSNLWVTVSSANSNVSTANVSQLFPVPALTTPVHVPEARAFAITADGIGGR